MRGATMVAVLLAASAGVAAAADADAGKTLYKRCAVCHAVGEDAQNKTGPQLNGLDGRKAGAVADFDYSDALKASGIVWDEATFKRYTADPQGTVSDTKMAVAGPKGDEDEANLWAYLKQFDGAGNIKK